MTRPVYLDHHATTPLDPRVLDAMLPYLTDRYGNASSRSHALGWDARRAVDAARESVATLVGADPAEIVFTSGATESVNLALKGVLAAPGGRLVTAESEHRAVLETAAALEASGARVTRLPVDGLGRVDPDDLQRALVAEPGLVSLMAANNEVGTLHPLDRLIPLAAARGALFHSDASQAVGKVAMDVGTLPLDLMSFTAHKIHGPKGIGALFIRKGIERRVRPQIHGGGQERGIRSGTLNVPAVVGFGAAAEIARRTRAAESERVSALRDRLLAALQRGITGVVQNGDPENRLPGNLSVSFCGLDGEALLTALPDVAASTGSACESSSSTRSHVLGAMGLSAERIRGSLRFGLGRGNTEEEIDRAARRIAEEARRLRALAGAPEAVRSEGG